MISDELFDFRKYESQLSVNRDILESMLKGEPVVPLLSCTWYPPFYVPAIGYTMEDYLSDPEMQLRIQLEGWHWRLKNFPEECITDIRLSIDDSSHAFVALLGCDFTLIPGTYPWPEPIFDSVDEACNFEMPELEKSPYYQRLREFHAKMEKAANGRISVDFKVNYMVGIFSNATQLVGPEKLLIALIDEPQKVDFLLGRIVDEYIRLERSLMCLSGSIKLPKAVGTIPVIPGSLGLPGNEELPAELLFFTDDAVVNVSPFMYKNLIAPHHRRQLSLMSKKGKARATHFCGDVTALLPQLYETLQPTIMDISPLVDLSYAREVCGKNAILEGHTDGRIIFSGPKDRIVRHVHEVMAKGGVGRFIMRGSTEEFLTGTPIQNIHTAYDTVTEILTRASPDSVPARKLVKSHSTIHS